MKRRVFERVIMTLLFPQQKQTGVGGLGPAVKINCDFLAADGSSSINRERRATAPLAAHAG